MTLKVLIYHNPRCSKSRKALEILRERGVEPEVIQYLDYPLTEAQVLDLLEKLGVDAHALVRQREPAFQRAGLTASSTPKDIARAIAKRPALLERPVVVVGDRAVIARPPDKLLELL